jgi:AcrR family transcriptional regulator
MHVAMAGLTKGWLRSHRLWMVELALMMIDTNIRFDVKLINMKMAGLKPTRSYTMRARAESTSKTRERILDAVIALSEERLSVEMLLADVAERAGLSVQTVLRHFGSRLGLLKQAQARQLAQVRAERATPVGNAASAVHTIVAFYDRLGEWSLRLQAQEHNDELSRQTTELGRRVHREWVEEVFAPQLAGRIDREELVDLLVVATDLLTWKILRRDSRMDRSTTCKRMLRLVRAVLSAPSERS